MLSLFYFTYFFVCLFASVLSPSSALISDFYILNRNAVITRLRVSRNFNFCEQKHANVNRYQLNCDLKQDGMAHVLYIMSLQKLQQECLFSFHHSRYFGADELRTRERTHCRCTCRNSQTQRDKNSNVVIVTQCAVILLLQGCKDKMQESVKRISDMKKNDVEFRRGGGEGQKWK